MTADQIAVTADLALIVAQGQTVAPARIAVREMIADHAWIAVPVPTEAHARIVDPVTTVAHAQIAARRAKTVARVRIVPPAPRSFWKANSSVVTVCAAQTGPRAMTQDHAKTVARAWIADRDTSAVPAWIAAQDLIVVPERTAAQDPIVALGKTAAPVRSVLRVRKAKSFSKANNSVVTA